MKKYKAEITFIIEIESEDADDASDLLWYWNPLHPQSDPGDYCADEIRIEPNNVEFEEIKDDGLL